MVVDPIHPTVPMLEPLSKMTEGNKKQYIADVRVMNYLLQAIPNDIYNSVDASKEGESLDSVHERLTTLVNIMDRNNVRPIPVAINTKFINCLQPEWRKYVTMKAAKNHDPLALIAHSNASSSHSYENSSYSPQPYYVTHPPSVVDYDDEYQGELQGDSQEDKLTTAMMLLARAISQKSQGFNIGKVSDESNQIIQRVLRTESTPGKANVQCYNYNEKGHYACECQKPKVHDAKYYREQILLAMKDEAGSNLSNEENDFMLDTSYGEDLEELTAAVMLMARLQPADENAETVPSYDAKTVSQVHASFKVHEQVSDGKRNTIIQKTDDDQIDSSIMFDDPFVENNGGTSEHDSTAHDEYREIQMLAYNVQRDAENQKFSSNDSHAWKKPNKVYDPFLKAGLGYTNHVCLKKAIAAQPMYDGDLIHNNKLVIHTTDSEETLEDTEENQNKMRHKMVQMDYEKINALYETYVPQQELSAEQTYFLIPSTSDNGSKSKDVPSESPGPKIPTESQLLTMIDTLGDTIFYKADVILMSISLYNTLREIKEELIEEVQKMLNIFVSMEQKVNDKSPTEYILENEIDRILEASLTSEIRNCVLLSIEQQKHELLKVELEKSSSALRDIQANLLKRIKILKNDFQISQAQSIEFELELQHQKEKM
ncbi:retrovirus-related pol polyprotein from transposon TNT 1-94, partial [Tanacetum coccineum]